MVPLRPVGDRLNISENFCPGEREARRAVGEGGVGGWEFSSDMIQGGGDQRYVMYEYFEGCASREQVSVIKWTRAEGINKQS